MGETFQRGREEGGDVIELIERIALSVDVVEEIVGLRWCVLFSREIQCDFILQGL